MRNIVQIDFNDMNNCGVLNSASSESSILLCITPEDRQKTSLKVEITGSNGEVLTSPELTAAGGMVRYEADREYWTEAGTMKVRVLSGEGNSGYAEFQIIENMSGGNVQVKQAKRDELKFEVIVNGKEKKACQYITAYINNGKTVTGEMQFDHAKIEGNSFALENGKIVVKEDVSLARVHANIGGLMKNSYGRIWTVLNINGMYSSPKLDCLAMTNGYGTSSFSGIVSVKKGDIITTYAAETIGAGADGVGCTLTVERIE